MAPWSRAQGDFDCRGYVVAWLISEECRKTGTETMSHIESCSDCRTVVFGDLAAAAGPLVKVESRRGGPSLAVRGSRRVSRRRFVGAAAASLAFFALAAGGVTAFRNNGTPSPVARAYADWFHYMDSEWQSGGTNALAQHLLSRGPDEAIRTLNWIQDRGHVGLYGVVVLETADTRIRVKKHAIAVLGRLPALQLKPYLPSMRGIYLSESHPVLRAELFRLLQLVDAA